MRPAPFSSSPAAPRSPWDPALRELLKRYPPTTLQAGRRLRAGDRSGKTVRIFLLGVTGRHQPHRSRSRLRLGDDHLRLTADLGLDSLSLLETVVILEEVMAVSVSQDQLRQLRTVGDVVQLVASVPPGAPGSGTVDALPPDHQPDGA
jgi:acyl carrier protein